MITEGTRKKGGSMTINNGEWGDPRGPNAELWDQIFWSVSQWICQQRALRGPAPAGLKPHIENPANDDMACDWCYDEAFYLVNEGGLGDLLAVQGSVAYACGRAGVPEGEAAKRALQAVVERCGEIEGAKILLAELDGSGWWRVPPEQSEQGDEPQSSDDEPEATAGV